MSVGSARLGMWGNFANGRRGKDYMTEGKPNFSEWEDRLSFDRQFDKLVRGLRIFYEE